MLKKYMHLACYAMSAPHIVWGLCEGVVWGRYVRALMLIRIYTQNVLCSFYCLAHYEKEISELAAIGASVITVTATDKDLGENARIKYSFDVGTNVVSFFSSTNVL